MTRCREEVKCTVHDGALCMHLDAVRVNIPSHLLNESKVLLDALSSACDSSLLSEFTLDAPAEWLQALVACFGREAEPQGIADVEVLVNCLKVCTWHST
jgi:hypothetical protein